MHCWSRKVHHWPNDVVNKAISQKSWQAFCLTLVGLSLQRKLKLMERYLQCNLATDNKDAQVQVDHYITGLLETGVLELSREIKP